MSNKVSRKHFSITKPDLGLTVNLSIAVIQGIRIERSEQTVRTKIRMRCLTGSTPFATQLAGLVKPE